MIFSVHLLRGLRDPSKFFVHLNRSSTINGFWSRLILILITYLLIGFFQAYLGIGMEELMVEWETTSNEKIEVAKIFMGFGIVLGNLLKPIMMVILFTIALTLYLEDITFKKVGVIQLYTLFILLIEKVLSTIIYYFWGITFNWNIFSLAPIFHMFFDYQLILILASKITMFHVWAFVFQFKVLKGLVEIKTWKLFSFLVLLFIFFLSIDAIVTAVIQELDLVL